MGAYTLKILIEIEAPDDLAGRAQAAALVRGLEGKLDHARDIVLHATVDRKSIRMNKDGSFVGQWNRGGMAPPPEAKET